MPETVKEALPRIREVLEVMGIPTLRVHGVEADDVIGTVATRAVDEGFFVAIASPDKVLPASLAGPPYILLTLLPCCALAS